MSATPEQIAELCEAYDIRQAASFIRAQAERVRVLESALKLINEMDGEYQPARSDWDMLRIAQAALKAAP